MLIDFNFTNFMSFKETAEFDMRPIANAKNKKNELYDYNVAEVMASDGKKFPLLLSSVVYGANASGKTSFIQALRAMERIILEDGGNVKEVVQPFKLNAKSAKKTCRFEITILAEDNVVYEYGFSATAKAIHEEWLNSYPKGRIKELFKRTLKDNKKGDYQYDYITDKLTGHKKTKNAWEESTTPQRLFLSTAIQLNNQELLPVFNWFAHKLYFIGTSGVSPGFSVEYCQDGNTEKVVKFLENADMDINNIEFEERDVPKEVLEIIKKIANDEGETPDKITEIFTLHRTQDGKDIKFDFKDESQGTRRMFSFAGPILAALSKGHILVIDELDNSLHPLLVKHIIELFQNKETNPKNAQLIFTTHDTSLLNEKIFLREQVWLCDKNPKEESKLYSLIDFKPRKDITNLQGAYLSGRYKATPIIF